MTEPDNRVSANQDLIDRIKELVGDVEIDLDQPLPTEVVSEDEYHAALAEGLKLMDMHVNRENRLRMKMVCELIENYEAQLDVFSSAESETKSS